MYVQPALMPYHKEVMWDDTLIKIYFFITVALVYFIFYSTGADTYVEIRLTFLRKRKVLAKFTWYQ